AWSFTNRTRRDNGIRSIGVGVVESIDWRILIHVIQQICSILVYVFAHIGFLWFSKIMFKMRCRRSLVGVADLPARSGNGIQYQSGLHHFDQAYPRLASTLLHRHDNIHAQTARLCCKFVVTGLMQRPASAAADSRL